MTDTTNYAPVKMVLKSTKQEKRPKISRDEDKEQKRPDFITGITADGNILSTEQQTESKPLVIPLARQRLQAVFAPPPAPDKPMDDLERAARDAVMAEAEGRLNEEEAPIAAIPLLRQSAGSQLKDIADEKERLDKDIAMRPDEASLDAYAATPIDKFGEAMMRGMGWQPGQPVGLTSKVVVQPIEFVRRHHRGGLGSEIPEEAPPTKHKKYIKPGESRDAPTRMRMPVGPDGKVRHVKTLDEDMIEAESMTLTKGSLVVVSGGRHRGFEGRFIMFTYDGKCLIKLTRSGEEVTVREDELERIDEAQLRYDRKHGIKRTEDPYESKKKAKRDKDRDRDDEGEQRDAPKDWVQPRIRVRVVNKKIKDGRVYMKKGVVVDVIRPGLVTVQIETGDLCELKERYLETALPKVGGEVLVLRGPHRGMRARLLERNSDKNQGAIQLNDDLDTVACSLDDIAEFV